MGERVTKVWSKSQLISLTTEGIRIGTQVGEIRGKYGERIASAEENGNLPARIVKEAVRLCRVVEKKGQLAFIEAERQRALMIDHLVEAGKLPDPGAKDLVDQAQDDQTKTTGDGDDDDLPQDDDPDQAAADANGKAIAGGIKALDPPNPNAGTKESQSARATRKRQEAEKAAQAIEQAKLDKQTRKSGKGDLGASARVINLDRSTH